MEEIASLFELPPWPHQLQGVADVIEKIQSGSRAFCLTSPTGGGKSAMMRAILRWATQQGWKSSIYTNRILLTEQLMMTLDQSGMKHGVRAAAFEDRMDARELIQISQIQTEWSRTYVRKKQHAHKANLVLIDEAHLQANGRAETILRDHMQAGATIVGVTATPLDISHLYPELLVAGTNSQLRQCKALVPALVFAPNEMDTSKIRQEANGEFNYEDIKREVWSPAIIDYVFDRWKIDNPDARQAIGFAPGVPESIWCAEQYYARGVRAAHIDGEDVWVDGKFYTSDRGARQDILAQWKAGEIRIVWNRFVLREGIDQPQLYHLILACPIGSLKSYIQTVGRVLRYSEHTPDHVIITDHGGNYWRHGSPNDDQNWSDKYWLSSGEIAQLKINRLRHKHSPQVCPRCHRTWVLPGERCGACGLQLELPQEPIACMECGAVRSSGRDCPQCGFVMRRKSRAIIQRSGSLVLVDGDAVKPRRTGLKQDTQKKWDAIYWPSRRSNSKRGMTFSQAEGMFYQKHRYFPPRTLNNMPIDEITWMRRIRDVKPELLIGTGSGIGGTEYGSANLNKPC